jgi:photosystem II stability/assembly factor-like uncharacterized protein
MAVVGLIASAAGSGLASSSSRTPGVKMPRVWALASEGGDGGEGSEESEALEGALQHAQIRTLPEETAPAAAYVQAVADAAVLPVVGGDWTEVTNLPYNSDDPSYRDPIWSNSGGGAGLVAGRIQGLAVDDETIYAATASGGVWVSPDGGKTWSPKTDGLPSLSSGDIAIDPADGSAWYATGEASTAFENYLGQGVYRSSDGGASWDKVGKTELDGTLIGRLAFNGEGRVFAATGRGVYWRATSWNRSRPWNQALAPGTPGPYGFIFANDVAVQPGTNGRVVVATFGWRSGPTDYSGFYRSTDGGATWDKVQPKGDLRSRYIGRASFAYAGDGSRLYVLDESWQDLNGSPTGLHGIFVSTSGDLKGPWDKIAGANTLAHGTGSAMEPFGASYKPGAQAWYNQAIAVDPNHPEHLYIGMEEVYETVDGGETWTTIGPYWNFTLPCYEEGTCSMRGTHVDQHAFVATGNRLWVGNDGGVYAVGLKTHEAGHWKNLNANLHALQYYGAAVSNGPAGDAYWGGMQDNGESFLGPSMTTMVAPWGGDGGFNIVDPNNPDRAVSEYVDMDMNLTTNGGLSDGTTYAFREISPSCTAFTYTPDPCDPFPRFIAPIVGDPANINTHWVAGGAYVWETHNGWNTTCSADACDWTISHDLGLDAYDIPRTTTALAVSGGTIYAGWCGGGCNPGPFTSGIDANASGSWTRVADESGNGGDPLPQRYVSGLAVDPADAQHVFAVFGGYSRRWIPSGGVGHVFESTDGGATWTDISGSLPDVPFADIVVANGMLVAGADVGVFVAHMSAPTEWSALGAGLPNVAINELTVNPAGTNIVAATHGRGIWIVPVP